MCWWNDIKLDELPYQRYVSGINILKKEQRKSKYGTDVHSMKKGINILSYVDFLKLCHVITHFHEMNQKFTQEDINFFPSSNSRAIE